MKKAIIVFSVFAVALAFIVGTPAVSEASVNISLRYGDESNRFGYNYSPYSPYNYYNYNTTSYPYQYNQPTYGYNGYNTYPPYYQQYQQQYPTTSYGGYYGGYYSGYYQQPPYQQTCYNNPMVMYFRSPCQTYNTSYYNYY